MFLYTLENMYAQSAFFGMKRMLQKNSRLHTHSYLEMAYVEDGTCTHILNGQKVTLKKGDYFIIDYNCAHQYFDEGSDGIKLINCMFQPIFIDPSKANCNSFKNLVSSYAINIDYNSLKFDPSHYIFHDDSGYILSLFLQMYEEYCFKKVGYLEFLRYALSQIIILTLRKIYDTTIADKSMLSKSIIKIIKLRYNENNLLKSICEELHYTMPYLSSAFKKETGMTFKEYQTNVRIDYACKLLTTTNEKIPQVAEEVGYKSLHFFTSVFKEKTGVTPTEFRKIAKI